MKTITLNFQVKSEIKINLKGLSYKSMKHEHSNICRSETGYYFLEVRDYNYGGDAYPKIDYLLSELRAIKRNVYFDKIRVIGRYKYSGDELLKLLETT